MKTVTEEKKEKTHAKKDLKNNKLTHYSMIIQHLHQLPELSMYKYIYISIGSKYNEDVVVSLNKPTNAFYQMVPSFVSSREEPTLAIAIDFFHTTTNIPKTNKPIQLFLFDISEQSIETVLKTLFDKVDQSLCQNVIVANFVRFISPNDKEASLEIDLFHKIPQLVSKRKYTFYQWFGYIRHLYSILYKPSYSIYFHLTNICKPTALDISPYRIMELENDPLWKKVLPYMIDFIHTTEWNQTFDFLTVTS